MSKQDIVDSPRRGFETIGAVCESTWGKQMYGKAA